MSLKAYGIEKYCKAVNSISHLDSNQGRIVIVTKKSSGKKQPLA